MGFVQIISFRTDRYDEYAALEQQWLEDTEGSRTVVRQQTLVDRNDPRHHVAVVEFASYESAMANSGLPQTDALARKLTAMTEGAEFGDYDVVTVHDVRRQLAAALRESMATGHVLPGTLRDDAAFEGLWPHAVARGTGPAYLEHALHEEAPSRTFERWDVTVTETGFVAEYSYRTQGEVSYLSMGVVVATVEGGRISRLVVTCGGSWDAEAEATILGNAAVAS
ncbi:MAG TPA: hypothetical protein VFE07_10260 [Marmoricola sp.]|jgi:hypothetical protein|nr:hypothetical protein [Marmoricola sp.]